uniref:Uncharacterized protein n=1 Tax=Kalanchoe fedtschenkoi TaxID=63787 RepID=A0A7N0VGK7_KALFE
MLRMFGRYHSLEQKILWVFLFCLTFLFTFSTLLLSVFLSITLATLALFVLALAILIWLAAFVFGTDFSVVLSGLKPMTVAL